MAAQPPERNDGRGLRSGASMTTLKSIVGAVVVSVVGYFVLVIVLTAAPGPMALR